MPHARRLAGNAGEDLVSDYLEQAGYTVVTRQWHAGRYAEIDIVAVKAEQVVFVEVKSRHGLGFGWPEEAVTRDKQAKLRAAGEAFLLAHPQLPQATRFDVVAVLLSPDEKLLELKHYENVV